MQPDTLRLRLAAILGLTAVWLGALGAHGKVHDMIKAAGKLETWETAVSYQLPHAILLVALALLGTAGGRLGSWAWRFLFLGVLLFCGSLYLQAYTLVKWLVYVTPFGGVSLMAGWGLLIFSKWTRA